jgi:membrane fusion protein, multidrug efflux system
MTPATRYLLPLLALLIAACAKEDVKPPEQVVAVTTASVASRDLAIVESAVGAETAIGSAIGYDPTRVNSGTSYVRLPFPEHVAVELKVGQAVTVSNFTEPERNVRGKIREIRPALNATTLSREVIVAVPSNRNWRPEGSVRGEVTLGVNRNALVVPEQALVLRPAGSVVYVIDGNVAKERPVKTGIARDGMIQITAGLAAGETVAVDGAALLSDGAKVNVQERKS